MQLRHVHYQMVKRCTDPKHPRYSGWGAQGIRVHSDWHDFDVWAEAMGPRPPGMTIERIDNAGNYEPGNVRWATALEQAHNKATNYVVEIEGVTKPLVVWARENGIHKNTLRNRLNKGMDPKLAVTLPVDENRRKKPPPSTETKAFIMDQANMGIPHKLIAEDVGRAQPTVSRWIRKWRAELGT